LTAGEEEELLPGAEYFLTGEEMDDLLTPLVDVSLDDEQHPDAEMTDADIIEYVYKEVKANVAGDTLYRMNFFQNMFPHYSDRDELNWWMPESHAISILLQNRGHRCVQVFRVAEGAVVVWKNDDLHEIIDYIVSECNNMNRRVLEDPDLPDQTTDRPVRPEVIVTVKDD
jgi:hypothetical protein